MALDLRITIRTTSDGLASVVRTEEEPEPQVPTPSEAPVANSENVNVPVPSEPTAVPETPVPVPVVVEPPAAEKQPDRVCEIKDLFEYRWPPLGEQACNMKGEWYVIQEILSHGLGVKSFKRRYPDLNRHIVSGEERHYLLSNSWVTESTADLGLTAIPTQDALQLLQKDFPEFYPSAAVKLQRDRERLNAIYQAKLKEMQQVAKQERDEYRLIAARKKAVENAARYNRELCGDTRRHRTYYWDLQTCQIHIPTHKRKIPSPEMTKPSNYPVALICGQFTDSLPSSWQNAKNTGTTSIDLKYLPLSRPIYGLASKKRARRGPRLREPINQQAANDNDTKDITSDNTQSEQTSNLPSNCTVCGRTSQKNDFVQCCECKRKGHAECMELPVELIPAVKLYAWQCMECKRCQECRDPGHEDSLMVCDKCDRGYHAFCVGLSDIPHGRWECPTCVPASVAVKEEEDDAEELEEEDVQEKSKKLKKK